MPKTPFHKIVFRDTHAELVAGELPFPGNQQVLIRARCSLISPGTEKAALNRIWDDPTFRENPGYALAGDIVEAGQNTAGLAKGDRVIAMVNHADWSLASADPWVTLKIPTGVSYEQATLLPLASVALHAIRRAQITLGETFVIIGMGLIGQMAITLAKMQGARQVIALDLVDQRLEPARLRGADLALNPGREDVVQEIFAATGGKGAPVILEATGNTKVIPEAFRMAAIGGRIVSVGIINEDTYFHFYREFQQRELSLIAANQPHCPTSENIYWQWTQQANRQLLLELMAAGKLCFDDLISNRYPASQAPQVYELIREGATDTMGILLDWA
jgi:2-desacetyl-2-hydroxyethyl bacteriochlorophyllide A dehydrogenase